MTTFVYVVSIAFHVSVPAFRKCTHTSRKKFFWLRVQPLVHRLLHLFVGPERLASHRLFECSKDMKITGSEVRRVRRMWKTLRDQTWIVATVERAVWGGALSRWSKTPVLGRPRRLDLTAGRRLFFRRSAYVVLVTGFTLGMQCSKITPCSSHKRVSITFPADDCMRNFFGFGEEVWRHSSLAFLVSGWW